MALNLVHFIVTGLSIYAAVQAGRGRWYRLPLPFRIVPGAKPAGYQLGQVSP